MKAAENLITTLQEQIQNRMEKKNLTAHGVERKAGLKTGAVQNILIGRSNNPGIEALSAIAKLLDCSVDELIGKSSTQEPILQSAPQKQDASKNKPIASWNPDLYQDCTKEVQNYLNSKKFKPNPELILFFIREAYSYSLRGNDNKADLKFIQWIIDNHH